MRLIRGWSAHPLWQNVSSDTNTAIKPARMDHPLSRGRFGNTAGPERGCPTRGGGLALGTGWIDAAPEGFSRGPRGLSANEVPDIGFYFLPKQTVHLRGKL